jgi:FkbM family methyltransferase
MSLRQLSNILRVPFTGRHYLSVLRSGIYCDWPGFFLKRYILEKDSYPYVCRVRTPIGYAHLTLHSPGDAFTMQEIFGLGCYPARKEEIIVDFGANIGISAAYFLTRNPSSFVYGYEPLPENFAKLEKNLQPFAGRFVIRQVAIADKNGTLSFYTETSGRLSGFDCTDGDWRTFPCVSALEMLREVIHSHGRIDILKIDVEGAERVFMPTITDDVLQKIGRIYLEGREQFPLKGFIPQTTVTGVHCYVR